MRSLISITILLIASVAPVFPQQEAEPLSLDDCIRLARNAQSSIDVARRETEIARSEVNHAIASFLPQAGLNNTYTYNSPLKHNPEEASFISLDGFREYNTQLTAVQELDISGKLRAELARARADRDAATASLSLNQRDLKRAVSAGYYRLLLARHLVRSAKDALEEAQAFAERTRLLSDQGEASKADVFKALSEVASLEQSLSAAELDAEIANHDLASFWTDQVANALVLEDVLAQPPPTLESILGTSGTSLDSPPYLERAEFGLLDAQQRGFLADSRRARSDILPQASIVFQYGIDSSHMSMADRGYAVFVNLDIPVFDWFKARNLSRQSRLKAQQVQVTREVATRTFSKEYQDALSRLKSLFRQVSMAEERVNLSEENLRMCLIRYEGGEGSALEVVAAQNQLAEAHSNYYTLLAGCWNAKIDLEVATGQ